MSLIGKIRESLPVNSDGMNLMTIPKVFWYTNLPSGICLCHIMPRKFASVQVWVNYEKGVETLILSDKNKGFTNPRISPDGTKILCEGSSISSISKKPNLDIFVVNLDGTNLIQLTYHPANDCCPVWSPDGKYIYFLSSRANEKSSFNIWRIRFDIWYENYYNIPQKCTCSVYTSDGLYIWSRRPAWKEF